MKLKISDELLKGYQNISLDDATSFLTSLSDAPLACPLCKNTTFSFIVKTKDGEKLVPFFSTTIDDDECDEHVVYYKISCVRCSNEVNLNAHSLLLKIKEMHNE